MKLPQDTIIAEAKITHYLLRKQQINDKSQFLARAGYCLETANKLEQHLREQILSLEATYIETDRFGDKYQIIGELSGLNGISLKIITIWMTEFDSGKTKFITLYPNKK